MGRGTGHYDRHGLGWFSSGMEVIALAGSGSVRFGGVRRGLVGLGEERAEKPVWCVLVCLSPVWTGAVGNGAVG